MPYTVSFEKPGRFVVRMTGDIPRAVTLAVLEQVRADPRFAPGATMLVIVAGVASAPAADELPEIAAALRNLYRSGLAGFALVADPGWRYGVARMFATIADIAGVGVHVTQDEAEGRLALQRIERESVAKQ